jgi:hypothetical protein
MNAGASFCELFDDRSLYRPPAAPTNASTSWMRTLNTLWAPLDNRICHRSMDRLIGNLTRKRAVVVFV